MLDRFEAFCKQKKRLIKRINLKNNNNNKYIMMLIYFARH